MPTGIKIGSRVFENIVFRPASIRYSCHADRRWKIRRWTLCIGAHTSWCPPYQQRLL